MYLECRSPRGDVIAFGAHRKDRDADVGQRDWTIFHPEASLSEVVVEEELAQILRVHAIWHSGRIRVPGHQVGHRSTLAHQVIVHYAGPDEIVGLKELEGPSHLPGVQMALSPHQILEKGHLVFIDEQRELASLSEVLLGSEKRDRLETLVAITGHRSSRDRQKRTAEAITDGMDLPFRHDYLNGIQSCHYPEPPIVLHSEVAIAGIEMLQRNRQIGILPGDHEHREAALGQVAHQRVRSE